jgi:hypothetical protein
VKKLRMQKKTTRMTKKKRRKMKTRRSISRTWMYLETVVR